VHRERNAFMALLVFVWSAGQLVAQAPAAQQQSSCTQMLHTVAAQVMQALPANKAIRPLDEAIAAIENDIAQGVKEANTTALCLSERVARPGPALEKLRKHLQGERIDQQIGASSSSAGSTSAVSAPSAPALLGFAFESGGITKSIDGTNVTYRTNPAKLVAAFAKQYGGAQVPLDDIGYKLLERLNVGLTFDSSRTSSTQTTSSGLLLGRFRQISEASARIDIVNHRDPFSRAAYGRLHALMSSAATRNFRLSGEAVNSLTRGMSYQDIAVALNSGAIASEQDLQQKLEELFDSLYKTTNSDPAKMAPLERHLEKWAEFEKNSEETYRLISKSPVLTLEYSLARPPLVQSATNAGALGPLIAPPDQHVARLLFASGFIGTSEFTLNASATFFSEARSDMRGLWRDAQAGARLDIPLPTLAGTGKGSLTFSGLYLHLHQKPLGFDVSVNDEKVNRPGNIGLFQAKLTLAVGNSGFSVPISLTAANRTELIKEKEVRGNIGVTFDLDKLLAQRQ